MHYILAFPLSPEKSLNQTIKELDSQFFGETKEYDSLRIVGSRMFMGDHVWEHPPFAFINSEGKWEERPPKDEDAWRSRWKPCLEICPDDNEYGCELEKGHKEKHFCLIPNPGTEGKVSLNIKTDMTMHRW